MFTTFHKMTCPHHPLSAMPWPTKYNRRCHCRKFKCSMLILEHVFYERNANEEKWANTVCGKQFRQWKSHLKMDPLGVCVLCVLCVCLVGAVFSLLSAFANKNRLARIIFGCASLGSCQQIRTHCLRNRLVAIKPAEIKP